MKPKILDQLNHGGVLWALLSGDKSEIDSDLKSRFQQTGTSHLLAISGMHIGLIAPVLMQFYRLLGWVVLLTDLNVGVETWMRRLYLFGSMLSALAYGHQVGWPTRLNGRYLWSVYIVLERDRLVFFSMGCFGIDSRHHAHARTCNDA